jgi:hypothetical protein
VHPIGRKIDLEQNSRSKKGKLPQYADIFVGIYFWQWAIFKEGKQSLAGCVRRDNRQRHAFFGCFSRSACLGFVHAHYKPIHFLRFQFAGLFRRGRARFPVRSASLGRAHGS